MRLLNGEADGIHLRYHDGLNQGQRELIANDLHALEFRQRHRDLWRR